MNTLFQQPAETSGIAGNMFIPLANKKQLPIGAFGLEGWQANPFTSDGLLVPNGYNMSAMTGFSPPAPINQQLGFHNTGRSSVAQMEGGTVGAYLNSADLPGAPDGQKMMITPQFSFTAPASPFVNADSVLEGGMDLQIPMAVGKDTYVTTDFLFDGPAGAQLSFGVELFHNEGVKPVIGVGYDGPSKNYMLNSPLGVDQTYVTMGTGAPYQSAAWSGFQHFHWQVTTAQFASALKYLAIKFPGHFPSLSPADYKLARIHLNAEFHFGPLPAAIGWSMRGWRVLSG